MSDLYNQLQAYGESDYYPFHMPGHKRRLGGYPLSDTYVIDITEIDGFDNLHHPEGILWEEKKRASSLWRTDDSYLLINGSTAGILSAVSAVARPDAVLIMGRNCHKAAYHAAYINRMETRYLYPEEICANAELAGAITPEAVEDGLLQCRRSGERVAAVFITSPTYEGMTSDIASISAICHRYDTPLIVDEAHGAHFGFACDYPESAIHLGADLVIQSLHKTLPSMTQTAVLHQMGNRVSKRRVERFLALYQTSSPSYVLMSSMDICMDVLEREGEKRFHEILTFLEAFKENTASLRNLKCIYPDDPLKLVIASKKATITGKQIYDELREKYHLQLEMAAGSYCLAMFSMMDEKEGFVRLAQALCELDERLSNEQNLGEEKEEQVEREMAAKGARIHVMRPVSRMPMAQAYDAECEKLALEKSVGKIAAEFVSLYPPGIPLLVPGEEISSELVQQLLSSQKKGLTVLGLEENTAILVVKDRELKERNELG